MKPQTLLYVSTGTGPYNEQLDPITINEWWYMAENDVMEMTKQGVPGVWTYGFYDGWVPNYMFFLVHSHNAIGRFYEVQSYGAGCDGVSGACARRRTWPGGSRSARGWRCGTGSACGWWRRTRWTWWCGCSSCLRLGAHAHPRRHELQPEPRVVPARIPRRTTFKLGPAREHQHPGIRRALCALWNTGKERERFLENYWIKNKNAIKKGVLGPIKGWVIPASQHAKANAAEAVNELIDQGLEFHVANSRRASSVRWM